MGSIVGGGGGGFLSAIGSIVGTMFGGPIGAMIGQALGSLVQNMLGQAMQGLGLNQDTQDAVMKGFQDSFREDSGGLEAGSGNATPSEQINQFADAAGLSDADRGTLQRLSDSAQKAINDLVNQGAQDAAGGDAKANSKGGGSWLIAIAKALGSMCGKEASKLVELSGKMDQALEAKSNAKEGSKAESKAADEYQKLMTQFQAESQLFNMLSNVASTAIKSLGEGMSTIARKQ